MQRTGHENGAFNGWTGYEVSVYIDCAGAFAAEGDVFLEDRSSRWVYSVARDSTYRITTESLDILSNPVYRQCLIFER